MLARGDVLDRLHELGEPVGLTLRAPARTSTPQLPSTTEVTPCQHEEVRVRIPRDLRVEVRVHVDEARA